MSKTENTAPIQIVVLQRGWVAVGHVRQEGTEIVLENASIIRRWGTSKGLGEIAAGGPTHNTVLDAVGKIHAHELSVVLRIDADPTKWGVLHG